MSEVNASHVPTVTRKAGDVDFVFAKFTPRDRANLLKGFRQERRDKLAAHLKQFEIPMEQQFAELDEFDSHPPYGNKEFFEYINTPEGQASVHERSFQKANKEAALDQLDALMLSDGDSLALAAEICNLTLSPVRDDSESAEGATGEPGKLTGYGK